MLLWVFLASGSRWESPFWAPLDPLLSQWNWQERKRGESQEGRMRELKNRREGGGEEEPGEDGGDEKESAARAFPEVS